MRSPDDRRRGAARGAGRAVARRGSVDERRRCRRLRRRPRECFLPDVPLDEVYLDRAFVTRWLHGVPVSSSSQPAVMAVMLEQLEVRPGDHVLEIGAGTGYNAALLARLVGPRGQVTSVELDAATADGAARQLVIAGATRAAVVTADGVL
ncbi:MAG: rRNA adenine N-6-methyltransferase family protein, partial [Dehalococcoidia bacterium]